jgi:putative transposase
LWEGRFRSSLIDSQGYLMRCHRYIEMNPVRAGMVSAPHQYPWSSFKANAWAMASPIVHPHPAYMATGGDAIARAEAYAALFDEPESEDDVKQIRLAVNGGFPWGSDAFVEQLASRLGVAAARRRVRDPKGLGSANEKSRLSGLTPG